MIFDISNAFGDGNSKIIIELTEEETRAFFEKTESARNVFGKTSSNLQEDHDALTFLLDLLRVLIEKHGLEFKD